MTETAISQQLRFNDESLAGITSFDDALSLLSESGVVPESMDDYGTGFKVLDNKDRLIGVPFVILSWRFNDGDYETAPGEKGVFVSCEVVTKHGEKYIINDGGSGICRQLNMVSAQRQERNHPHPQNGLLVDGGLTKSEYEYTDEKGKTSPATTYYLSE